MQIVIIISLKYLLRKNYNMKRSIIFLFITIFISNYSYGNVSGYIENLAAEFSSEQNFVIEDNSVDSDGVTTIKMSSPSYYDCAFAISMIGNQMLHYSNAKMVEAWSRTGGGNYSVGYRVGTSYFLFFLSSIGENNGVQLDMSEFENYYKSTNHKHKKIYRKSKRR